MAVWPVTLPQSPRQNGYKEEPIDTRLYTQMTAGTRKVRNRFTATPINITESYVLTLAQYETLKDFYRNDLDNGALSFTKTFATEETTRSFRFRSPISPGSFQGPLVVVNLELEVLP